MLISPPCPLCSRQLANIVRCLILRPLTTKIIKSLFGHQILDLRGTHHKASATESTRSSKTVDSRTGGLQGEKLKFVTVVVTSNTPRPCLSPRPSSYVHGHLLQTVIKKEGMHEHADINEAESGETLSMGDEDHHETEATNTASRRTADDDEEEQGGFVHRYCRQKTNLEISTSQHNGDDGGNSRMECQICLADFEVGDKICWSNNPECVHTFHIGCLEPWLMKHDECPLCRCKYLVPRKKEPPSEMETYDPNAQRTSEITRHVVAVLSLLFFFRRITTVQQTRQDQNNDEEEIDRVPEISGEDQITINDDDNPPSPNMIPLEDVSDCSPTEEMVEPSDIERGDTTTSSR